MHTIGQAIRPLFADLVTYSTTVLYDNTAKGTTELNIAVHVSFKRTS